MREALARAVAGRDARALGELAAVLEAAVGRPARAQEGGGAVCRVGVGPGPAGGPWVGYLLPPDGERCWLALCWAPPEEAGAVRDRLPLALEDHFRPGPIETAPGPLDAVVTWVAYALPALPADHRLLNDLHAMVMLRDLLAERTEPRPGEPRA